MRELGEPLSSKKAKEMIDNVMLGFEKRINGVTWMGDSTKQKALDKLHKLTVKIAYPDKWKDYSALQVKGIKKYNSKLTPADIRYIRSLPSHTNWSEVARQLNVGNTTIQNIKNGKTWKHIK